MKRLVLYAMSIALLLSGGLTAGEAATVTITPVGNGAYSVTGAAMDGVAGIQLAVTYRSDVAGRPTVGQGSLVSGALLSSNATLPGQLTIAIVRPAAFSGSGQLAGIQFPGADTGDTVISFTARLIDAHGANLPVQTVVAAGSGTSPFTTTTTGSTTPSSTIQPSTISSSSVTTQQSTGTATVVGMSVPGTVTMPGDVPPKADPKPAEAPAKPAYQDPEARQEEQPSRQREAVEEKPAAPEKVVEPKQVSYAGVLDRFRDFTGERTPAAMLALFDKPAAPDVRQEPAVAVSDGSPVRVSFKLAKGDASPTFNLLGLELLSFERDGETGELVLEVRPKMNVGKAVVIVLTEQTIIVYPLTVVPPIAETITEAAFAAFLKDSGAKKPRFDLNGDGVHDGFDDFIYTGNYLVMKGASHKAPTR